MNALACSLHKINSDTFQLTHLAMRIVEKPVVKMKHLQHTTHSNAHCMHIKNFTCV